MQGYYLKVQVQKQSENNIYQWMADENWTLLHVEQEEKEEEVLKEYMGEQVVFEDTDLYSTPSKMMLVLDRNVYLASSIKTKPREEDVFLVMAGKFYT
ncbi:hypothetical protein M3914_003371 [Vibrio metschnikovii]|nr:hypothetical protein [Vibrio metschnikovii]